MKFSICPFYNYTQYSQGTGLGLSLCKILVRLMDGAIWLDEAYDSGVPGRPGSRFVIDLCSPPIYEHTETEGTSNAVTMNTAYSCDNSGDVTERVDNLLSGTGSNGPTVVQSPALAAGALPVPNQQMLPPSLSVLFVDDDPILRKLLVRAVRAIAPAWKIQEAASGEAALRFATTADGDNEDMEEFVDPMKYDLIFMDQYMASMEKQLLGTETTQSLRSHGVKSTICGLSANDLADDFFAAGASAFICKPLPVKKEILKELLLEILSRRADSADISPDYLQCQSSLVVFPPENKQDQEQEQ